MDAPILLREHFLPLTSFLFVSVVGLLDSWSMVVQRMMDNPESLLMKEVGGKDKVLLQSMRDSVDWLTARLGLVCPFKVCLKSS